VALQLWEEGYQAIQYRINDSHEFWNRWVSIELEELSKSPTPDRINRVKTIFFNRLQTPQSSWDETSQKFSAFLTQYDEASYESSMVDATRSSEFAKQLYSSREKHELKLQRAADSGDKAEHKLAMKDYLDWECKQARIVPRKGKMQSPEMLCVALFERALCSTVFGLEPEFWQEYIAWIGRNRKSHEPDISLIYHRATAHCRSSGILWARYILTAEAKRFQHHDIEMIKHSATNSDLDRDGMTSVVEVYIAWCGYLSRRASIPGAPEEDVDLADMGLPTALEDVRTWGQKLHGKMYEGDPQFRIERIMIQYSTHKGLIDEARGYWKNLINTHANSYDFWQQYYLWEMTVRLPNAPATMATDVLFQCVNRYHTLDWPEKMLEVYVRHANIFTDAATLITALDTASFVSKGIAARREKEAAAYAQQQPEAAEAKIEESPSSASKRKREASPEKDGRGPNKKIKSIEQEADAASLRDQHLVRDRENTSVLVTNLPLEITQTKVRQYFKEYGHINNVTMKREADGFSSSAFIEFRSNEDVQSALLRDGKYLTDKQIHVVPATGFTLYLTNYPPSADDNYFEELFKDCGEIFSIRYPSLKFKTTRRFCYITFRTHEAATAATKLHGHVLEGGFKLTAMYSDPSKKKNREGPLEEGRELHITGIDNTLVEDDLKEVFSKYGSVETVRILKTLAGVSKGAAFVVFEKKDEAISALELDKTKLKSRVLTVEISTGKNFKPTITSKGSSASPAPEADRDPAMSHSPAPENHTQHGPSKAELISRTITLMNIPDTVNDARVRVLAEKYGSIVKLTLRPDHQGAIIEYANASSASKAALGLAHVEITPGRKLRTGDMKDLFREKDEIKTDRIQIGQANKAPQEFILPGAPVSRPGKGGRGGLGTKKGLGFSAAKTGPSPSAREVNGTKADETVTPKSNADFKKMFLSGETQ
jgi:RNA recognition motif-containing protein